MWVSFGKIDLVVLFTVPNESIPKVGELAASADIFPTEEDCRKKGIDYSYYKQRRLNPNDELNVSQIIWDLIVDRVLTDLRWAYALSLEQTGDYDGAARELRKIIAYDASFKGAQYKLASMTASSHPKS